MKFSEIENSLSNIAAARKSSEDLLAKMRKSVPPMSPGVSIIANGSLARREITSQSDFDAYPLYAHGSRTEGERVFALVRAGTELKQFSKDGVFGEPSPAAGMGRRIGGQGDDNHKFTRRMLLLLESICLGPTGVYDRAIDSLLQRYISDDITEKQIGRFLLNDFIRFYRTMCVDFEFKTIEQSKPWGIRYTKLIFSRKLIYFSGVVMCASLAGLPASGKRDRLRELIGMSPVDRLLDAMGGLVVPALVEYDLFLGSLNDPSVRAALGEVTVLRSSHTDKFKQIKASGHRFSTALVTAFRNKYPTDHPVREAVLV